MRPVSDLLREALRRGDEQGRTQIRGKHLPGNLLAELAAQTHRYALDHAEDAGDGWQLYREGIGGVWIREGRLTDSEFSRLYMLRTDVVKRLTDQHLAYRPNPRSIFLYVRREAA